MDYPHLQYELSPDVRSIRGGGRGTPSSMDYSQMSGVPPLSELSAESADRETPPSIDYPRISGVRGFRGYSDRGVSELHPLWIIPGCPEYPWILWILLQRGSELFHLWTIPKCPEYPRIPWIL